METCSLDAALVFASVRNRLQPFATVRNRLQSFASYPSETKVSVCMEEAAERCLFQGVTRSCDVVSHGRRGAL